MAPRSCPSSDPRLHTVPVALTLPFQSVILMDSHRRLLLLSTKYLRSCVCLQTCWSFYCWCAFQREELSPSLSVHLPIKGMGVVPSLGQWWVKPQKDTRIQFLDKYKPSFFLGKYLGVGFAGLYGRFVFNFLRNRQTGFQSRRAILHSHQQRRGVPAALHPGQHAVL